MPTITIVLTHPNDGCWAHDVQNMFADIWIYCIEASSRSDRDSYMMTATYELCQTRFASIVRRIQTLNLPNNHTVKLIAE